MITIKTYTDLEQSKKLAEILSNKTSDMYYWCGEEEDIRIGGYKAQDTEYDIPCWSLSALLSVLPKIGAEEPMIRKMYYANEPKERYICEYGLTTSITSEYDNPIDACYEMIIKLHEFKML